MKRLNKISYLLLIFLIFSTTSKAIASSDVSISVFADVPTSYGYFEAINYLKDKGVITEYEGDTFRPDKTVSRAEFIAIILKAKNIKITGKKYCFKDVENELFAPSVCEAKSLGFIKGFPDGLFHPEKEVNLVEASVIMTKAFDLKKNPQKNDRWYQQYIVALEEIHAIPFSLFEFDMKVRRGPLAEMIYRVKTKNTSQKTMTYNRIKKIEAASLKNDIGREALAQAIIEENGITFNPSEMTNGLPEGVSEKTAKEIKALAIFSNSSYKKEIPKKIMNEDKKVFLRYYKGVLFITIPFKDMYFIYSGIDASTSVFVGKRGGSSNVINLNDLIFIQDINNVYKVDHDNFLLEKLDAVDSASFKYLISEGSTTVFKDKNHVYHFTDGNLYSLDDINANSFKINILYGDVYPEIVFFTDKSHVYYVDPESLDLEKRVFLTVTDADPETFEGYPDRYGFFRDKNRIYNWFKPIEGADLVTFEIQKTIYGGEIFKDKNSIFVFDQNLKTFKKFPNFDLEKALQITIYVQFEEVPLNIFKYEGKIYSYDIKNAQLVEMPGSDVQTFEIAPFDKSSETLIFKDKNAVYYQMPETAVLTKIDADRDTFEILNYPDMHGNDWRPIIAKDKNQIYTGRDVLEPFPGIDASTFELLAKMKTIIVKDKNAFYEFKKGIFKPISGVDPDTFEVLQDLNVLLARDKNRIYATDSKNNFVPFTEIDEDTFEIIAFVEGSGAHPVIKDKDNVFFYSSRAGKFKKIKGADARTFEFLQQIEYPKYYFKDKNGKWLYENGSFRKE